MLQAFGDLHVATRGKGLIPLTALLLDWVGDQSIGDGLLTVWCRHTSASLLVQENADPDVRADIAAYFERVAPEQPGRYRHDAEGPDDMPAHLRAALTQTQLSIPVRGRRPLLGTWQGVYLFEHRSAPHRRDIVLHLIGDPV